MKTHAAYCDIVRTTLKSLYRGIWEVEYDELTDNYVVCDISGKNETLKYKVLEGIKLRTKRNSAKAFVGYIVSILGRPE